MSNLERVLGSISAMAPSGLGGCQDREAMDRILAIDEELNSLREIILQGQGTKETVAQMNSLVEEKKEMEKKAFPDLFSNPAHP